MRPEELHVYNAAKYYDIACIARPADREIAFLNDIAREYGVKVRRVLEVACGSAPLMERIAALGWRYAGIDICNELLEIAKARARALGIRAHLHHADLRNFWIKGLPKIDLAFVCENSLYVSSNEELLGHLSAMARVLKPGALYCLDECIQFSTMPYRSDWVVERNGTWVHAWYEEVPCDAVGQRYWEKLRLEVVENGAKKRIEQRVLRKYIYPQEWLTLLQISGRFEHIGFFANFDAKRRIEKLENAQGVRVIAVIRRK